MSLQLILALLITCSAFTSQAQTIEVGRSPMGFRSYFVDDIPAPRRTVIRLLKEEPNSKKYILKSRMLKGAGLFFITMAVPMSGYFLSQGEITPVLLAAPMFTIGFGLDQLSNSCEQKAIDAFHQSQENQSNHLDTSP
mgnify:CR=1 FL=1